MFVIIFSQLVFNYFWIIPAFEPAADAFVYLAMMRFLCRWHLCKTKKCVPYADICSIATNVYCFGHCFNNTLRHCQFLFGLRRILDLVANSDWSPFIDDEKPRNSVASISFSIIFAWWNGPAVASLFETSPWAVAHDLTWVERWSNVLFFRVVYYPWIWFWALNFHVLPFHWYFSPSRNLTCCECLARHILGQRTISRLRISEERSFSAALQTLPLLNSPEQK